MPTNLIYEVRSICRLQKGPSYPRSMFSACAFLKMHVNYLAARYMLTRIFFRVSGCGVTAANAASHSAIISF